MHPRGKRLAFAGGLAAIVLVGVEFSLQVLALASARVSAVLASPSDPAASAPTIPDARLEFRSNPALRGHDGNGFRNPRVLRRAEIVALGDSQTYGTGVGGEEAWPRVLEQLTGHTTYSMAAGGYGPVHGLILMEEARALEPSVIIEALYSGNDLYDAFRLVHVAGQLPELRDPTVLDAVREAQEREPIAERVDRMFAACTPQAAPAPTDGSAGERGGLRARLSRASRLYGLLRRLEYEFAPAPAPRDRGEAWEAARTAAASSEHCLAFSSGSARTVLTPDYRLTGLDLGDPRIREGARIALRALGEMHAIASRHGIRFLVLMIPTKELVFSRPGASSPSARLSDLMANEQRFWSETREFLSGRGIEFIEVEAELRAQLERGPQPYQVSADGHPDAVGHRVIAQRVAEYLERGPQ